MKREYISHLSTNQTKRLILLFLGWGMESAPLKGLHKEGYDILAVSDYRDTDDDAALDALCDVTTDYGEIVVIGWSFGVRIAASFISRCGKGLPLTRRIAINGTPEHIHNHKGIPEEIFAGTLRNLNELTLRKFRRRMFTSTAAFNRFNAYPTGRPLEKLRRELERFGERKPMENAHGLFDLAIIGSEDAIVPPANQRMSHEGTPQREYPGMGHYPDFQEILDSQIVDKQLVAKRFGDATSTYRENATIQRKVARKLWEISRETAIEGAGEDGKIIEIGAGKGILTEEYCGEIDPTRLELWDIAPIDPKRIPTGAKARQCDAEQAIREEDEGSTGLILSSSTIQWFNNPEAFIRASLRALRPGGVLALSTFGEKNFAELRELSGNGLNYPTLARLKGVAEQSGGEIVEALEEKERMEFCNGRRLLEHLRLTGVNAINSSRGGVRGALHLMREESPTALTYHPIFLTVRKN